MSKNINEVLVIISSAIGLIVLVALVLTLPTYFLWNWLMPIIFGLKELTLFQALGVTLLSTILFRSSNSSK